MRKLTILSLSSAVLVTAAAGLLACSSSTTTGGTDGGATDSGGTQDSGGTADSGGGKDSGGDAGVPLNGCTSYVDHTATSDARAIAWDLAVSGLADRCMKIKAGQSVTWTGNFTSHPLAAAGGDTPNPITNGTGASKVVAFPSAGSFGYVCQIHGSMTGAILVEP